MYVRCLMFRSAPGSVGGAVDGGTGASQRVDMAEDAISTQDVLYYLPADTYTLVLASFSR